MFLVKEENNKLIDYKKVLKNRKDKILVNQENFEEYAKELGYKRAFLDKGNDYDYRFDLESPNRLTPVPNSFYKSTQY